MIVQIRQIIFFLLILCIADQMVFSQDYITRNNYTGSWETPTSWIPTWNTPQTSIGSYDIIINGYITVNGSLTFTGVSHYLIVNDTLVILGNLSLSNNQNVSINGNGIIIVRGDLILNNSATIFTNNYLIVTGDVIKNGSPYQGLLLSNNNPEKVFIGGAVSPASLTDNNFFYPALNCTAPSTFRYPNSNCGYGNMTDFMNDPLYPFFLTTCPITTPTITASGSTTFCAGGSVTLTSSSGTTYLWSNGATTASIIVTASGSYAVRVTNSDGCQSAASTAKAVTVNALPATPTITADGPTTFCDSGSVMLTSSAGISYLWSNGATTQSISVTASGSYTVKVTNANGCQSAASVAAIVTVNPLPAPPTIIAGGPTTFCNGGSVTLTSSAGSTYLWSNGATTQTINVTSAGNYTVSVINANGCQRAASEPEVVTVNSLPSTPTVTASGPTIFCAGGSVTLTSSVGSTYLWSNGESTSSIIVTSSGSYGVKVTNASGCQSATSELEVVTVNTLPITPAITAEGPTTFCEGGSVTITSSAGTTYLWSTGATSQSIDINATGNYTVQVTNENGCQSAYSVATVVTVNPLPAIPTITAGGPITFCTGGNVYLTSSAGSTFLWSNGAATPSINVTTAGNYTVRVTNANGCQSPESSTTIIQINSLPAVEAGTDITIPTGTSTILNATVTGTGPFTYSWSPPTELVNASLEDPATVNLASTTIFTLTATSSVTSCSNSDAVTISTSGDALSSSPKATPDIICSGSDVQLQAIASGGSGSYTYTWTSAPGGFTSSLANPNVNPAISTTYNVAVYDGFSTVNAQVTVIVNPIPAIPTITAGGSTTLCAGDSVTLTSVIGNSYLWSNGESTQSINVTTSGSYTVQVTNASECQSATSAATVVIVNVLPVTPTITTGGPTTFCDGGHVTLTSSTESIYIWSNGETTQSINVATPGSYTIQVKNASGCQSAVSTATVVTVNALPETPAIAVSGPTTFCAGGNVTLTSDAAAGYLWSNGETKQSIDVYASGSYTVQVTDANGCKNAAAAATVVTVKALPEVPTITAGGPTSFCDGGSVTLTSGAGYSYLWSNGETSQSINVTKTGNYAVQVTNAIGCQSAASATTVVTVNAIPATPAITARGSTTFCDGSSVTLTSSAGASYLWSSGETESSINITTPGSFTVQVKNESGCQSAMSTATVVTVNALPETPMISVSGPTIFCDGSSVTLTSSTAAGYLWSNGAITQSINVTLPGSYASQVTNASGCQSEVSAAIIVTVNPLPMTAANSNSPICVGDAINFTSSGGASYIWNGPEGFTSTEQNPSIPNATSSMSGRYMVTATSLDGCTGVVTLSILVNEYPLADAGPNQDLGYINSTQMQAVLTGAETGEWSLISGSGNILDLHSPTTGITGLSNGENIFSWKVQNGNCEASAEVILIVKELFIPSVITPNGDDKNDYFKIREIIGQAELIIFNRWGNEEYTNDDYKNDWDGRNNKGVELPNDTYFYILKLEDGNIKKGSVLIKR